MKLHPNVKRLLPFCVLVLLILVVYLTNIHEKLTLENLQRQQEKLMHFVSNHPVLTPLIFVLFYIVSVCMVIPDSTILTILSGMIFPLPLAIFYSVFSEVVGAVIFFAIFRGAFGESLIQKERPFLNKMRRAFKKSNVSYLLFLRVSHVFPFWLTNIAAAYFKVKYWTFTWTTFIGVIPLSYILADAGQGLSKFFAAGQTPKLSDLFNTQMKLALLGLGLVALIPLFYKKYFKHGKWKI